MSVCIVTKLLLFGLLLLLCYALVNTSRLSGTTKVLQASVKTTELQDGGRGGAIHVSCPQWGPVVLG